MIRTKEDLKEYIRADESRYSLRHPKFLGRLLNDESYYIIKFLRTLRKLEYYTNRPRKNLAAKICHIYFVLKHRRLEYKTGIRIAPNIVGKGLYIPHLAGGVIINALHMGNYCIVNSGAIIGNKSNPNNIPSIGDNVEITIGAKVIGKVNVGDHAIVAPNSVVIKDVEPYSVVSGVPAVIIKKIKND